MNKLCQPIEKERIFLNIINNFTEINVLSALCQQNFNIFFTTQKTILIKHFN